MVQGQRARGLSSVRPSVASPARVSHSEVVIPGGPSGSRSDADADDGGGSTSSVGERLRSGESVLELRRLASPEECERLVEACLAHAAAATPTRQLDKPGLVRLPTVAAAGRAAVTNTPCADPLPPEVDRALGAVLRRTAEYVDRELPSVALVLFGADSLAELMARERLKFSSREPAVNVYTEGGEFLAHKDAQALTVLLPLSRPGRDFAGGGTAFWHQDARGHRVEGPSAVLRPPAGTALLFGGCVTHAGVSVDGGSRVVFVASFSPESHSIASEQRDIYGDSM